MSNLREEIIIDVNEDECLFKCKIFNNFQDVEVCKMIVYHGSNVEVREPKILKPNRELDFGNGFYTTTNAQAPAGILYSPAETFSPQRQGSALPSPRVRGLPLRYITLFLRVPLPERM